MQPILQTLAHVDSSHPLISSQLGFPWAIVAPITTTVLHLQSSCGDRIRTETPSLASKASARQIGINKPWEDRTTKHGGEGGAPPQTVSQPVCFLFFFFWCTRPTRFSAGALANQETAGGEGGGQTAADVAMAFVAWRGRGKTYAHTRLHLACLAVQYSTNPSAPTALSWQPCRGRVPKHLAVMESGFIFLFFFIFEGMNESVIEDCCCFFVFLRACIDMHEVSEQRLRNNTPNAVVSARLLHSFKEFCCS